MAASTGTLLIVSTPIGNLDDFSPRAKQILSTVDYILCETTQQTRKLGITTRLTRYEGHGFKAKAQQARVIQDLSQGKNVALVSNAGTPLISDPGLSLVQAVVSASLPIVHIPGPVAFVSALITSGLPTKNVLFIGFLPKKDGVIQKEFEKAKTALRMLDDKASLVCYVSKYQIQRTLDAVKIVFGASVSVSLARELTKLYEEHKTGRIGEIIEWVKESKNHGKGEFTLVLTIPDNNV